MELEALLPAGLLLFGWSLNELSHVWRDRRAKAERKVDFERQLYRDLADALPRVVHSAHWRRTAGPDEGDLRDREFWQALADWKRLVSQVPDDALRSACETFSGIVGTHHIAVIGPYAGGVPSEEESQRLLEQQRSDKWMQLQDDRKALAENLGRMIRTRF